MRVNKMCEKTLLENIQGLEKQIQLADAKEKEIAKQRVIKVKQDVETTKSKALALKQSTKAIFFYQLLRNQGEELSVVLIEAQLSMVQLYDQKEQDMVMELNAAHTSLKERK